MNEIFKKIYSEKDDSTNISLFIASLITFILYLKVKDTVIITLVFICFFSATKVLSGVLISYVKNKSIKSNIGNIFSETEKAVIKEYVKKGVMFISMSDYKKGVISGDGLDSLVSRGYVEFIDNSFGNGPSGFQLREDIYITFINKK